MRGSLNDFSTKVGETSKTVLEEYFNEIEIALGSLKVINQSKEINKEKNVEEEIR